MKAEKRFAISVLLLFALIVWFWNRPTEIGYIRDCREVTARELISNNELKNDYIERRIKLSGRVAGYQPNGYLTIQDCPLMIFLSSYDGIPDLKENEEIVLYGEFQENGSFKVIGEARPGFVYAFPFICVLVVLLNFPFRRMWNSRRRLKR